METEYAEVIKQKGDKISKKICASVCVRGPVCTIGYGSSTMDIIVVVGRYCKGEA